MVSKFCNYFKLNNEHNEEDLCIQVSNNNHAYLVTEIKSWEVWFFLGYNIELRTQHMTGKSNW